MSAVNNTTLVGRVVRKQEFDKDKGTSVLITLAVNRPNAKEGQQQADFIECQGFINKDKPTKMYDYVHEKDLISIDGEIHSYKDKNNYTQTSINIQGIGFLEKYKKNETSETK